MDDLDTELTPRDVRLIERALRKAFRQGRESVLSPLRGLARLNGDGITFLKAFEEAAHPRDHGKFAPKGGGASGGGAESTVDAPDVNSEMDTRQAPAPPPEAHILEGLHEHVPASSWHAVKAKVVKAAQRVHERMVLATPAFLKLQDILTTIGDHPDDLKVFGYTPVTSGVAGHQTPDALREATGVPGTIGAKLAAHVLARVLHWMRKGLSADEAVRKALGEVRHIRKAAAHAPKGGVSVQGKDYKGGEFIPADVMEQATPEEKAKVEGKGGDSEPAKEKAPHEMTRDEFNKKPLVRIVGKDFPLSVVHGTTERSAKAFIAGKDLPESERSKTFSEWGDDVIYTSEKDAPHQAVMFSRSKSKGPGGKRVMIELSLKPGAKILDLSPEMTRRPAVNLGDDPQNVAVSGTPTITDDMGKWLNEVRAGKGLPPMTPERLLGYIGPDSPQYLQMVAKYARDRGYAAVRLADETVIVDRGAIQSARGMKREEVAELEAAPRKRTPYPGGGLYTDKPDHGAKDDAHRLAVESALSQGKPVPPEVLADYPDLQGK